VNAGRLGAVRIVLLFPELLGTYGDGGNAVVLARRLEWRGIPAEVVLVAGTGNVPDDGDIYVLGGGEDGPQVEAARTLAASGVLHRAAGRSAVVFGVCAGMQILGTSFPGPDGTPTAGLGLLDCATERTGEPRAVGELLVEATAFAELGELTGFENHGGRTRLGPRARPLGTVVAGTGNGSLGAGTEGVVATDGTRVLGTYLHGPALARNPALADLLLGWVVGDLGPLAGPGAAVDNECDDLRSQRLAAVRAGNLDGVLHRTWRDRILGRN